MNDVSSLMQLFSNPVPNANIGGFAAPSNATGFNFGNNSALGGNLNFDITGGMNNSNSLGLNFGKNNLLSPGGGAGASGGGLFDNMGDMFNSENFKTLGNVLGAGTDLFSIYAGLKSLGFAEDRNDMMKTNMNNQANLTNERLATRQASRLRSRGITGEDNARQVAEFMAKNGVSGA